MILVTGATGTVGKEVVKQLSSTGEKIRVMVRNVEKAAPLKGPGVEVVQGDFGKPDTLASAVKGVEKVFLLSSADPRQVELQGNVLKAAKSAGVKHLVKLSALGARPDSSVALARGHYQTEKQIQDSGIPYTHLQPHFFMQNLLMFADSIKRQGAFYAPMKQGKISLVDVRDIAAVAARVLTEKGHERKTYAITGPEALSFGELAEKFSRVLGRKVAYVDVPPEDAKKGMLGAGMPEWLVDDLLALYGIFSAGHAAVVSKAVEEVTKKPARTFDQFAKDFARFFKGN